MKMYSESGSGEEKRHLDIWVISMFVFIVLALALVFVSGGWSAHAATLGQTQGKDQQQLDSAKGSSPDDVPYLINEKFLGDNLASSVFYSQVATCVPGGCGWNAVGNYWFSPARSAMAVGPAGVSDQQLILNTGVVIPSDAVTATLAFHHYYNFEATGSNYYDGGVLEVSTDSGSTWSDSGVQFTSGGYNVTLHAGSNPLAGRSAWGGDSSTYVQTKANLLSYAGHTVLIRFREGTDTSNASIGWSVDDIELTVNTPTPCSSPAWDIRTPYTLASSAPASVVYNGLLYLFGGRNSSGIPATESYRYNPVYNQWYANASMPEGRYGFTAVTDGRYIYLVGGYDYSGYTTANLWRYDPALNTYTALADSPHAIALHAAALYGGRMFRFGGFDDQNHSVSTVDIYNISSNTWSAGPDYPISVGMLTATVDGLYIYTAGGYHQTVGVSEPENKTYRYNPNNDTWDDAAIADLPDARSSATSALLNGRILVAGGYPPSLKTTVIAWEPSSNAWTSLPDMPQMSYASGGGAINQAFYVVGGYDEGNNSVSATRRYSEVPCVPLTPSPTPTNPPTSTPTATATATACPLQFSDVPAASTFYSFIECLACRGIVSGYADGTFRPGNDVTRGQIAKIVSNAAGFTETHSTQTFTDIPTNHTFYQFIERLASRNIIAGYACGGVGEPCGAGSLPYFRSNNNATRGQLAKIVCKAFNCSGAPSGQTFEDVPTNHTFYTEIEQLYALGAINGYACGGVGEPCGAGSKPYFRPGANVSRGQTTKIVGNVFFPSCQTP